MDLFPGLHADHTKDFRRGFTEIIKAIIIDKLPSIAETEVIAKDFIATNIAIKRMLPTKIIETK